MIDVLDTQILGILQDNARTSNAEIARRVGLAPSAVHERIRKLEERGIISGYAARIEPKSAELGLLAFIFVRSDESPGEEEAARALAALPEVQEVHHVAGEDCFLVKVRTRDTDALGALLRDRLKCIPSVRATRTTIVLDTIKESATLPLGRGGDATRA
jgi:Lrp/AsnC family leucine-responsive transcriptional regulator